MLRTRHSVFFLFAILSLYCNSSHAIKVEKVVKLGAVATSFGITRLIDFQTFGFDEGGQVSFTAITEESDFDLSNIELFICNAREFADIVNGGDEKTKDCTLGTNLTDPILSEYMIPTRDLYHFLLMKTLQTDSSSESYNLYNYFVRLRYEMVNPNGQQLSVGDEHMPTTYLAFTIFWGILLLVWCFGCFWYRENRIAIHTMVVAVCFLKFIVVGMAYAYWMLAANTGVFHETISVIQSFFFAISETVFFGTLLLVAKGWRITRARLPTPEIRTIAAALVLLLSTLLFFSFYKDGYYFLSLMIMYFFMLPKIFTSITRNTRSLESILLMMNRDMADTSSVLSRIILLKSLWTSVILYLASILIVNALRVVMVWYLNWLNYAMNECVILVIVTMVSQMLSPAKKDLFNGRYILDSHVHLQRFVDDGEMEMGLLQHRSVPIDMTKVVIFQFPSAKTNEQNLIPVDLPLAIGVIDTGDGEDVLEDAESSEGN